MDHVEAGCLKVRLRATSSLLRWSLQATGCCSVIGIPVAPGTRTCGTCDLPGGHVEAGERRIDALVSELREELGIDIDPQLATSVLRYSPKPDLDIEVWAVHSWAGDVVNAEPAEHDRIGWFTAAELDALDLADPGVATACERALQHVGGGGPRAAQW